MELNDYANIAQVLISFLAIVISACSVWFVYKSRTNTLRDEVYKRQLNYYESIVIELEIITDNLNKLSEEMLARDIHSTQMYLDDEIEDWLKNIFESNNRLYKIFRHKYMYINSDCQDIFRKIYGTVGEFYYESDLWLNDSKKFFDQFYDNILDYIDEMLLLIAKLNGNKLIQEDLSKLFKIKENEKKKDDDNI